jgi:hypothetical protein
MKLAIVALLFAHCSLSVVAAEVDKDDVTGMWWGGLQADSPGRNPTETNHWVMERKKDGTYRLKSYLVDHAKKLFLLAGTGTGSWEFVDGNLSYLNTASGGEWTAEGVRLEGSVLRWEREEPIGLTEAETEMYIEFPVRSFDHRFGKDYRQVTEREFIDRYRPDVPGGERNWLILAPELVGQWVSFEMEHRSNFPTRVERVEIDLNPDGTFKRRLVGMPGDDFEMSGEFFIGQRMIVLHDMKSEAREELHYRFHKEVLEVRMFSSIGAIVKLRKTGTAPTTQPPAEDAAAKPGAR